MEMNESQQFEEMNTDEKPKPERVKKPAQWWQTLIVLAVLVASLSIGIIIFEADVHVPMLFGVAAAAVMALILGYKWSEIEQFMINGITKSLQSVIILVLIGVLVGVWIVGGVVPTMIYYGLAILKPAIFYLSALLICSISSLATGSSWATMGTMGIALLGISSGLGMNAAITAGAIISGAYFGDKMSPLSDTTNLAPSMAGTDVITHIKHMLPSTAIVYGITIIFFTVIGFMNFNGGSTSIDAVNEYRNAIKDTFTINPVLFIPPVIVIVAIALKMPAIPGISLGILSGALCALLFQNDCTLGHIFVCGMNGYESATGIEAVDNLLSTGGIMNMANSIIMVVIAMMFGGIMEETNLLGALVNKFKAIAKRPFALVGMTEVTCIACNALVPEQYISLIIPGRMYAEEFDKNDLSPSSLSNALEGAGTVSSALIPWNTCGTYINSTLHIDAWGSDIMACYGPWAIFNWLMPVATFVLAIFGLNVKNKAGVLLAKAKNFMNK